jgi:spore coat protein CotH
MRDQDYIINNYYLYRDREGTSEWLITRWDKNLDFGYVHPKDLEYKHPLFGDSDHRFHYEYNYIIDALHDTPITREMYVRRLRTLQDELLKPAGPL